MRKMEGTSDQTEKERFSRAIEGDRDAFWALMEPYGGLIYSVAYGIMKDPEQARDVLHEVYIKAFRSLSNLRNPRLLPSWLHSLTRNLCYDLMRKSSRAASKRGDVYRSRPRVVPIHEVLIREEELKILEKAIESLPEPFRLIVGMKYMNDLRYREIAAILDISMGAVKSRLFEARKLLAARMAGLKKASQAASEGGNRK